MRLRMMLSVLTVFLTCCIITSFAETHFLVTYKDMQNQIAKKQVQGLVTSALQLETYRHPLARVEINVYQDYFHVILYRSDVYQALSYRVNIHNGVVANVAGDGDYIEESDSRDICGTCPDPEIQAVFSTCETTIKTAVACIDDAQKIATDAGVKAISLKGKDENLAKVSSYFSCPKFRIWMRVGHGQKSGIQISGGSFAVAQITANAANMKGKMFHFNSCLAHNPPFEPAMIQAGVYWFSSGDVAIPIGTSEKVTTAFMKKIISEKKEVSQALKDAGTENKYTQIGGSGDPAFVGKYFFFNNTTNINSFTQLNSLVSQGYSVVVTPQTLSFIGNVPPASFTIYSASGKPIITKLQSQQWDLTSSQGTKVAAGTYIAVLKNGTTQTSTSFRLVK